MSEYNWTEHSRPTHYTIPNYLIEDDRTCTKLRYSVYFHPSLGVQTLLGCMCSLELAKALVELHRHA